MTPNNNERTSKMNKKILTVVLTLAVITLFIGSRIVVSQTAETSIGSQNDSQGVSFRQELIDYCKNEIEGSESFCQCYVNNTMDKYGADMLIRAGKGDQEASALVQNEATNCAVQ